MAFNHNSQIVYKVDVKALGRSFQKFNISLFLSVPKPILMCVCDHCLPGTMEHPTVSKVRPSNSVKVKLKNLEVVLLCYSIHFVQCAKGSKTAPERDATTIFDS